MKRIEANDPGAMLKMGMILGGAGKYAEAFAILTKAVEVDNNAKAHYHLSHLYQNGQGVEKDDKKSLYHLEEAAIGGYPDARFDLAKDDLLNGRGARAVKHWIIAATLGHDQSMKVLKAQYKRGIVRKEDLAAALRAHQAAVDATKSPQRDLAEKIDV